MAKQAVIKNNKVPAHIEIDEHFEFELHKFVYKHSYYEFFKKAFQILHPTEKYSDNWHTKYICDLLQDEILRIKYRKPKTQDIIINVPFRSSKSMIVSVMLLPWAWIIAPSLKFIYVSYSENLALEHAQFSRNLIASSWYQSLFGDCFKYSTSEDSKHFYSNTSGGYRKSTGTGGQITGSGGDVIVIDDGQNPKRAASEKERKNTIEFYDHTLYSRLNQPDIGIRINVQQRLHDQDLTGHLLTANPDQYKLIKIPAQITVKSKPIPSELSSYYKDNLFWPDRFSKKILENFEKTLGSLQSANQLQQETAPEEGNLVKRAWFNILHSSEVSRDLNDSPVHFYLDLAETEKQTSDFSAMTACFKKDNKVYVIDVVQWKREFYETVKFIEQYVHKMGYTSSSKIRIEPKSAGKSVVSQLRATTKLNVQEIKFKGRMDDKLTRLKAIQPILESERVVLLEGNYVGRFLDQICTFPNSLHDDMMDTFVYAVDDLLGQDDFDFAFVDF